MTADEPGGHVVGDARPSDRECGLLSNRERHVMLRIDFRHPQHHQLTRTVSLLPLLIITAEFSFSPSAFMITFILWGVLETFRKLAMLTETPLWSLKKNSEVL